MTLVKSEASSMELAHHPLRGVVLEIWVFSDLYNPKIHHGEILQPFQLRESRGIEADFKAACK